ncbi:MAG TPA: hypothetical protein VFT29_14815 [Gemmatimonadaceae bacterium]|nr:hypothetical protein [Gemmatimonadaceae bacterium]
MRPIAVVAVASLACLASPLKAQLPPSWTPEARTAAFVELGGSAGLYSLNLDWRLSRRFTFRGALAQYTALNVQPEKQYMRLAFMLNALAGGPTNWLEVGIGPMGGRYTQTIQDVWFASITSAIGFRHQTRKEGFVYRAGIAPQFQFGNSRDRGGASVYPGVSFGVSF